MSPVVPSKAEDHVAYSVRKYRRAHRRYGRNHPEIFNSIEQGRLREDLAAGAGLIATRSESPRALDLGCGSGNVTRHLLALGLRVLAADVSPEFLRQVQRELGRTARVETFRLNGHDLDGIPDGSLDMVCAYSVLHHIPDYLRALDDVCRVLAPGGVAYLDHEANDTFWDKSGCFWRLLDEVDDHRVDRANRWNGRRWWEPRRKRWQRYLQPSRYYTRARQLFDPAYPWNVEGDIHVWEVDHIEWDKVEERLRGGGLEVVRRKDYLNFSSEYPLDLWQRFERTCTNMRLVVARRP